MKAGFLFGITVAVAALFLIPIAAAAPIPPGGPVFAGVITPDKTLVVLYYFGLDGLSQPLQPGETLQVKTLEVLTFAPNAHLPNGTMPLTFSWSKQETITVTDIVNGTAKSHQETIQVPVLNETFNITASSTSIQNTELNLPEEHGLQLQIRTASGYRIWEGVDDTNLALTPTPPQLKQDAWTSLAEVVGILLTLAGGSVFASSRLHKKVGHVPHPGAPTILLGFVTIAALLVFWQDSRQELVLAGGLPLYVAFAAFVFCLSLWFWRDEGDEILCEQIVTKGVRKPTVRLVSLLMPSRNPTDAPVPEGHYVVVRSSWKDFFARLVGCRTMVQFPEGNRWMFDVTDDSSTPYRRKISLNAPMPPIRWAGWHWGRPEGAWFPRLRLDREVTTQIPVSPITYNEDVYEVIADLREMQERAEVVSTLKLENMDLIAKLRAGNMAEGRRMYEATVAGELAARTGKPLPKAEKEEERKRDVLEATQDHSNGNGNGNGAGKPSPAQAVP